MGMQVQVTGKHIDVGDALRSRITDELSNSIGKYFDRGGAADVVVMQDGHDIRIDCRVRLDSGQFLESHGQAADAHSAFNVALEKIDTRVRRYKRRLKEHGAGANGAVWDDVAYRVVSPVAEEDEEAPVDYAPAIVAESSITLRTMTVASAVIELDTKDSPVFVFRNAKSDQVNVVYRRADGNIGWIDPSTAAGRS